MCSRQRKPDVIERSRQRPGKDAADQNGARQRDVALRRGGEQPVNQIEGDLLLVAHQKGIGPEDDPDEQDHQNFVGPDRLVVLEIAGEDLVVEDDEHGGEHGAGDPIGQLPKLLPRSPQPAPRPARPPWSASSLEHALQTGGVPGLGQIGLGIDAIGRGAERRQIDGVDGQPAILQRLHDGLFVGEP